MKIPRKLYTAEFKQLTVKRIKDGQTYAAVAKDLQVSEKTLRNWMKADQAGKLVGAGTLQVSPEAMELSRLRSEVHRLKRECEILKKATAYFARESM